MRTVFVVVGLAFLTSSLPSCVIVPRYQREWAADPAMDTSGDALAQRSLRKLHGTREAASGGDGLAAGGGCACGQ